MPMLSPADTSNAQWSKIVDMLNAEIGSGGKLNACSWIDAAGNAQTSTIGDVRRSHDLFTTKEPTIGVQLVGWDTSSVTPSSSRRWLITEFELLIAAKAPDAHTTSGGILIPSGDDAMAKAYSFVSDGNGKGVSEIFRGSAIAVTLGGYANSFNVTKVIPMLDPGVGETPQMWAYMRVTCRAEKSISA